ncbi:zf-HC2 domain-containing protein [Kibdelosporangium philippinense]|uniref:Zf-HC2 domain-containing protein n=1 Tax=Kibdelosporangium philippinense TaxID=211113 RepID=A0ABS8Z7R5_9PSEU|nr:zf-HC2 domain-containing protein [Kibdelosporangium philippinense]MCE7001872.1 zf-HC2 domain-containing protein [Kibdelosporangium philippinense]
MSHVSEDLVRRYANGDTDIPADQAWALEAHMETCAPCRQVLASHAKHVTPLLDTIWAGLTPAEVPAKRRRSFRVAPAGLPWIGMTILVAAVAMLLDLVAPLSTSLVLLFAPIAPLVGVAASWNKSVDSMHELVAGTPRAGIELILRRTSSVLLLVIPALFLAGLPVNASPALWLLPCLAFTTGALAFGLMIGVTRAAIVLGALWVLVVAGPSVVEDQLPVVLQPASLPFWALSIAGCVAVLSLRSDAYARLLR